MKTGFNKSSCILLLSVIAWMNDGCSPAPAQPKLYTVTIEGMKFIPQEITLHKGDTVMWVNQDMVAHDVTEERSKAWTSSVILAGGSWKMAAASDADYYCSIHVVMKGRIKVQ